MMNADGVPYFKIKIQKLDTKFTQKFEKNAGVFV